MSYLSQNTLRSFPCPESETNFLDSSELHVVTHQEFISEDTYETEKAKVEAGGSRFGIQRFIMHPEARPGEVKPFVFAVKGPRCFMNRQRADSEDNNIRRIWTCLASWMALAFQI